MNRRYHEQARADFERARRWAALHALLACLRRCPNDLIPYHAACHGLPLDGESYRGLQTVPVDQIVGSTDRFRDFDRAFRPRRDHTAARWKSVAHADAEGKALPPVQLYQVGGAYFVRDGHHRVSVARTRGRLYVDAEVIEVQVRAPLPVAPVAEMPPAAALPAGAVQGNLRRRLVAVAATLVDPARRLWPA